MQISRNIAKAFHLTSYIVIIVNLSNILGNWSHIIADCYCC